jgi:putative oxidoreductase
MHPASERQLNLGLLLMRLGLAATLLTIALPRLLGGSRMWIEVARDVRFLQPDFPSQVVGLILVAIQVLGSLGLITGGLFRISTALIALVYGLHCFDFMSSGYKTLPLYAAALACVCIGLMITGPGRYSVAVKIEPKL